MNDYVKRKRVILKSVRGPVTVEYRERRDGRRGQLTVNGVVLETGPSPKIARRYHTFIVDQRQLA